MKKTLKKVCFRCNKIIEEKDNFYSFTEWNLEKVVFVNYAHRICWDEFLKSLSTLSKAQNMLARMEKPLEAMGILQPKEVIIN